MIEADPVLRPLREAADLLAERDDWPPLYDPSRLAANEVPAAAAVYYDDMYVDRELSMRTAGAIRGLRTWVTSEYEHYGLRVSSGAVLGRLIDMCHGTECFLSSRPPAAPGGRTALRWSRAWRAHPGTRYRRGGDRRGDGRGRGYRPGSRGASSPPHVASMPTSGRTQAALEITSGTPVLDISVARLDGTLLRVSTPASAPVRPVLSGSAPIQLSLAGTRPAPATAVAGMPCGWCSTPRSRGALTSRAVPSGPMPTCAAARWAASP